MQRTSNSTGFDRVQIEQIGPGVSQVWLHRNITETTDEDGNAVYTAEEVSCPYGGTLTPEEVEADFDAWWDTIERAGMTDAERIAELAARVREAEERAALLESGLVELAEIVGGE